jgi:hypothetical protein
MPTIPFWSDEFPASLPATKYAIQSPHHRLVSRVSTTKAPSTSSAVPSPWF